ncbi:MAG: hypothetical protein AB9900_10110 [Humidesulfovibrio sp.]
MKTTVTGTRDYINPAPKIDVNRYSWENPNQEKLALLFSPVDAKVTELMRYVTSQDFRPDKAWLDYLMMRFSWIDGVLIADANGDILERRPPVPVKRFSEPLVFESIWRETLVKTVVDYTVLGPEVYFGMPNFEGTEFVGLHVVSFDPRVLFTFCPHPEELFIVDPRAKKLWTAGSAPAQGGEELTAIAWDQKLLEESHGSVVAGGKHYTWLARYIGRDRFIYATESANASIEDRGLQLIPFFGSYK